MHTYVLNGSDTYTQLKEHQHSMMISEVSILIKETHNSWQVELPVEREIIANEFVLIQEMNSMYAIVDTITIVANIMMQPITDCDTMIVILGTILQTITSIAVAVAVAVAVDLSASSVRHGVCISY